MAGDWIKMRTDLADDPAVIAIAFRTAVEEDSVVGKLHKLWSWASRQCNADGNAHGVTKNWIDRYLSTTGFADAMEFVCWLEVTEDGIRFPRFDRHNSQTAKERALTAKRVASHKVKSNGKGNANGNASSVTEALPREEKRREESNIPQPPFPTSEFEQSFAKFWDVYPLDRDGKRLDIEDCRIKFAHIPPHQWSDVIQAAKHYAAGSSVAEGYVTKPAKFLLGKWADWIEPPKVRDAVAANATNTLATHAELDEMNRIAREHAERRRRRQGASKP